jgi:hypothetical protein
METEKLNPEEMEVGTDFNELLADSAAPEERWIVFGGKKWGPFKVKALGWTKKNRILASCTSYTQDGDTQFNWDKYYKNTIQEILVPPKGFPMEEIFLTKLNEGFGKELEKLCPPPFDVDRLIEKAKKGTGSSEQRSDSPQPTS